MRAGGPNAAIGGRYRTSVLHAFLAPMPIPFSQPSPVIKTPRSQRRNPLFFSMIFLAFLGVFWYHSSMLNRIEIALEIVVKNNTFDRLNSTFHSSSPAHPARVLSPLIRPVIRHCEQVAASPKELSSGLSVIMRRNACAALLRQPGTHPRRMRSAVF